MENRDNEPTITIHLEDVTPFLNPKQAQRIVLRYLHDQGVEGEIGCDEIGPFIRYYKPADDIFEDFSLKFYHFITAYGNK
jgi:hypothetical protein